MLRRWAVVLVLLLAGCASPPTPPAASTPTTRTAATTTPIVSSTPGGATSAPTCAPENTNCNGQGLPTPTSPAGAPPPGPGCAAEPAPAFSAEVTDLSLVENIVAPGNLAGDGTVKGHSHIFPKRLANGSLGHLPVVAPVRSTVSRAAHYVQSGEAIYLFELSVSCNVGYRVDHLATVSDKLAAIDLPLRNDSRTMEVHGVTLEAGERMGDTSGTPTSSFFDFGATNASVTNDLIAPSRLFALVHAVCPYDLFTPPLKDAFYAKITSLDGTHPDPPRCRSPARDVRGSLQGSWFGSADANNDVGPRAAIAPDSDGVVFFTLTAPTGEVVDVRDPRGRDPSLVHGGDTVCYQGQHGDWGAARLAADARTVELVWGQGTCPTAFPSAKAAYGRV